MNWSITQTEWKKKEEKLSQKKLFYKKMIKNVFLRSVSLGPNAETRLLKLLLLLKLIGVNKGRHVTLKRLDSNIESKSSHNTYLNIIEILFLLLFYFRLNDVQNILNLFNILMMLNKCLIR